MRKWIIAAVFIAACLFVLIGAPAMAEEAENITSKASITLSNNSTCLLYLTDERYISAWSRKRGTWKYRFPIVTPVMGSIYA